MRCECVESERERILCNKYNIVLIYMYHSVVKISRWNISTFDSDDRTDQLHFSSHYKLNDFNLNPPSNDVWSSVKRVSFFLIIKRLRLTATFFGLWNFYCINAKTVGSVRMKRCSDSVLPSQATVCPHLSARAGFSSIPDALSWSITCYDSDLYSRSRSGGNVEPRDVARPVPDIARRAFEKGRSSYAVSLRRLTSPLCAISVFTVLYHPESRAFHKIFLRR